MELIQLKMKAFAVVVIAFMLLSCCHSDHVDSWSERRLNSWCEKNEWFSSLDAEPGGNIDRRQFAKNYMKNGKEWKAAYDFLNNSDLLSLEDGRYDLTESTYANVQTYFTKDSADFEAHKKYIDIQYMADGEEFIETACIKDAYGEISGYDPERDIEFFDSAHVSDISKITPDIYTIIFPSEVHKPCLSTGENLKVKKIVIKIPYVE